MKKLKVDKIGKDEVILDFYSRMGIYTGTMVIDKKYNKKELQLLKDNFNVRVRK